MIFGSRLALLVCLTLTAIGALPSGNSSVKIPSDPYPVASAFMPALQRLYIIYAPRDADGILEGYATGALTPDFRMRICKNPNHIAVDDASRRVIVSCTAYGAFRKLAGISRTSIAMIIDPQRQAIIATIKGSANGGAGIAARPGILLMREDASPGYQAIDESTGNGLRSFAASGRSGQIGIHFVPPRVSGQPTVAFDEDGNVVSLIDDDTIQDAHIGLNREPVAAAFGERRLFVAEGAGGAIAVIDYTNARVERVIAVGHHVHDVAFDPTSKAVYVLCEDATGTHYELRRFLENGDDLGKIDLDRKASLRPEIEKLPDSARAQLFVDSALRRVYAVVGNRIVAIDSRSQQIIYDYEFGYGFDGNATSDAFDASSGTLYLVFGTDQAYLRELDLRATDVPKLDLDAPSDFDIGGMSAIFYSRHPLAGRLFPIREELPGFRAPIAAAVDEPGTLIVAEESSPLLSRFVDGSYDPFPNLSSHAPANPVFDGNHSLWFFDVVGEANVFLRVRPAHGDSRSFPMSRKTLSSLVGPALPFMLADKKSGVWIEQGDTKYFDHILANGISRTCHFDLPINGKAPAGISRVFPQISGGLFFETFDSLIKMDADCGTTTMKLPSAIIGGDALQLSDGTIVRADLRGFTYTSIAGAETTISIPSRNRFMASDCDVTKIVASPDDRVWALCQGVENVIEISPDRTARLFRLPPLELGEFSFLTIVPDVDGSLWYLDTGRSSLGHITIEGKVTESVI